jgi:glycosyltransferase involved in cell wall biosynthesis
MKIGFLIENYYPSVGGPYTVVKETVYELAKRNIKATVITKKNPLSIKKISLIKEIKKVDICHLYGGWTFFYLKAFIISYFLKKKIIFHPLGIFEPWAFNKKKIKKNIAWFFYQNKILEKSDLVHCVSKIEEKNLLKLNKNLKTFVLPYGISKNNIKKKIKKNKIKKKALFFSRIHPKKGVRELIKEWIFINNPEWFLDIVGPYDDKDYYDSLLKLCSDSKNDKIRFLAPVYKKNDKNKLFDNYDLFILPTKNDPFGMVILESLSRGLPVLTNKNTPWIDIKDYNAGWYIDLHASCLRLELIKIFKNKKNQFLTKSRNAIRLAKQFDWGIITEKYIQMYLNVLKS